MNLTGTNQEGLPHPASEESDIFSDHRFVPSVDTNIPEPWETETRYILRFEEAVFAWAKEQKKEGAQVDDAEISMIFNNFFQHLSKHPIIPDEKSVVLSGRQFIFDNLNLLVGEMRSNAKPNENDPYVKTTRGRNFFYPESSLKPYVRTLLGIKEEVYYSGKDKIVKPGIMEYIGSKIEGKKILNIGGKNQTKDLLTKGNMKPESFTNIDPFIDSEDIDMNSKGIYKSISVSAIDPDIEDKLSKAGAPTQYDEIWASFSVPVYLSNSDEIRGFFRNITKLLTKNGVARIFPLSLALQEGEDRVISEDSVQDYYSRKRILIDEIIGLSKKEGFVTDVIQTYGTDDFYATNMLLIQRLK